MDKPLVSRATEFEDPEVRKPRRRRTWLVATAAAALVGAIAIPYVLFFTPDSPPRLKLSARGGVPIQTLAGVPAGGWSVARGSVVGYRVREKLLRLPAPNDAVGRTGAITGGFRLESDGTGVLVKQGMRIDVDLSTLKSDDDRRDDHMRTMAIETDRFPTATFVSTADLVLPGDAGRTGQAQLEVAGDLTLHGVRRAVTIPLEAQHDGSSIEVVGTLSIGWDMFGMKQPNLSYVTVESDPTLEFRLRFVSASARTLDALGSEDTPT